MSVRFGPVEALLVADVGNTHIRVAVWDDDGLHDVQTVSTFAPGEWRAAIDRAVAAMADHAQRACAIVSVRPVEGRQFADLIESAAGLESLFVGVDIPLPLPVDVVEPREVGPDRVCSAAAAFERIQASCAVASFGTAITIDCVSSDGRFLGGAILPGLQMSCDALHQRTARLPQVEPARPSGPFGRSTLDAIVNGVAFGAVGALREIVERYATELREWPEVVVTGGSAPIVAELADFIDAHVSDLCLTGAAIAYQKACGATAR